MFSSQVKIEANRANAQFSTGPRTTDGKARSAQNARKHGLTAQQLMVKPEEREEFDELLAGYQNHIRPQGPVQESLFDELVTAAWNLRRLRVLLAEVDMLDPRYDRLSRHHGRIERTFHRSLKELKAMQTEACLHAMLPRPVRHVTPFLASPAQVAKRSQQHAREFLRRDSKAVPLPPNAPLVNVPNRAILAPGKAANATADGASPGYGTETSL